MKNEEKKEFFSRDGDRKSLFNAAGEVAARCFF